MIHPVHELSWPKIQCQGCTLYFTGNSIKLMSACNPTEIHRVLEQGKVIIYDMINNYKISDFCDLVYFIFSNRCFGHPPVLWCKKLKLSRQSFWEQVMVYGVLDFDNVDRYSSLNFRYLFQYLIVFFM